METDAASRFSKQLLGFRETDFTPHVALYSLVKIGVPVLLAAGLQNSQALYFLLERLNQGSVGLDNLF